MEEYRTYTLEELTSGKGSYGIAASAVPFEASLHTYLRITDINDDGSLNKSGLMSVDEDDAEKYLLKPNDIVFARTGNSTGRSYFYDGSDGELVYAGFLIKFTLDSAKVNPRILKYYTHSKPYYDWVQSFGTGSTRGNINAKTYGNMPITLPPRDIQDKIVEILKSLDDKIEVNKQINDNLEQQAQALFKSWFVDFDPFRDQPLTESELGMIPNGWRAAVLDELCSFISRGLTPKYDESSDELILGQTCVRNNIVTLDNARRHKPKQRTEKWVQQWDTLINSTGIGSLGRVGIVYFDMDNVAIDSHITVIRPKSALVRHYVGRNLLSRQPEIENMAVGSTGQTELPKERVKSLPIMLPDENALIRFNAIIEPIAYQLYRNIEESRRLASLRDALLPRLMSGELTIDDL
jgi:type I restriction enzyme S subunit